VADEPYIRIPEFNPAHVAAMGHSMVQLDVPYPELIPALHRRLAAGLSAVTTIQMILGCDEDDAASVMHWVACDPHDHEVDPVAQLDRECDHLRDFEIVLYERMSRTGFRWT